MADARISRVRMRDRRAAAASAPAPAAQLRRARTLHVVGPAMLQASPPCRRRALDGQLAPRTPTSDINHLAMERFDALVVGAGPAGSTAAFRLARAGARVLLVDKARFPRDKPCGGGLTVRAVRLLPFSVAPVVEEEVDVFELGLGYRRRFVRRARPPLVVMTQRRARRLPGRAGAGGGRGVSRRCDCGRDRRHGCDRRRRRQRSFAGRRDTSTRSRSRQRSLRPCLARRYAPRVVEFGIVPAATAGSSRRATTSTSASRLAHQGPHLREHRAALPRPSDPGGRAHRRPRLPAPAATAGIHAARGRTALVGDAAGLVDPVSGDGIYAPCSAPGSQLRALEIIAGRADDFRHMQGHWIARSRSPAASWRAASLERFRTRASRCSRHPMRGARWRSCCEQGATHPGAIGGRRRRAPGRRVARPSCG